MCRLLISPMELRCTSKFTMMRCVLVLWMLSAALCMEKQPVKGASNLAVEDEILSKVTSANKDFAFNLFKKLVVQTNSRGKNIFFSPISISVALAALSVGARGETRQQLLNGLGFGHHNLSQTEINLAFHKLLTNALSDKDLNEGVAVFVNKLLKPEQEFLNVLKKSYLADGFNVNFTNPLESADVLNRYVSNKTNGKINELVKTLDPSTLMILVSYIYYKGMWKTPFESRLTKKDIFTLEDKTKVSVQMMNRKDVCQIYVDSTLNTKVVHLPFNGTYSMLLLLPENMTTLETGMSQADVNKWMRGRRVRMCNLFVPKFSIKTSYSLKNVLAGMGLSSIFSDSADLKGISDNVVVSKIVHQATLEVDEVGVTAAAVTDVETSLPSSHASLVLKFNRPFMFIILERGTGILLFMGKFVNLTF